MSPEASLSAVLLSLKAGLWCAGLGAAPATALGWLLARRTFPGKSLLSTALLAPLVLPPVVTGLLLLRVFGARSPLGAALARAGLSLPFTFAGAVLASAVVSLPLFVMAARGAFASVEPGLEEAALTLGRTPRQAFLGVTLPLALPGLAAGAVLAFARALGEFGATIVLAGNIDGRTRTLPLAVYSLLESPGGESASRTLLWSSLGLAFGALLLYERLAARQARRLELEPVL